MSDPTVAGSPSIHIHDDPAPADSGRGRSSLLLAGPPPLAELVPSSRGHLLGHRRCSCFGTGLRQQGRLGCDAGLGPCHPADLLRTCSRDTRAHLEASEEAVCGEDAGDHRQRGSPDIRLLNDTTMRWPMFSAVKLRNELYLLVVGKGPGCFMIPKRAFTSQADETTFRELAERSTRAHSDPEDS